MNLPTSSRDKSILMGLYLSKFDNDGLVELGLGSFTEAFNLIGFALGVRPASIKNYRDEFDPLFPNPRKGWHKRSMRPNCKAILDAYSGLSQQDFARIIKTTVYKHHEFGLLAEEAETKIGDNTSFAKRLVTGQAAENYFTSRYQEIDPFKGLVLEDKTMLGCGFDFRLLSADLDYAVEVKGLNDSTGSISMTPKEYAVASILRDRYFLVVVKNFRDVPSHQYFQDPVFRGPKFEKTERHFTQVNWLANV